MYTLYNIILTTFYHMHDILLSYWECDKFFHVNIDRIIDARSLMQKEI